MDRRVAKTKRAIFRALLSLLDEKKYSQITIQDIIDRADIGRSTFYSHYETKDDLLKAVCADIFEHVFEVSLTAESSHDFSAAAHNPYLFITHILYHIRDNKKIIKGVLGSESGDTFMKFLKDYFTEQEESLLGISFRHIKGDIPKDFLINHVASSFLEMIRWWMVHDLLQTPEELTRYYFSIIPPFMKTESYSKQY